MSAHALAPLCPIPAQESSSDDSSSGDDSSSDDEPAPAKKATNGKAAAAPAPASSSDGSSSDDSSSEDEAPAKKPAAAAAKKPAAKEAKKAASSSDDDSSDDDESSDDEPAPAKGTKRDAAGAAKKAASSSSDEDGSDDTSSSSDEEEEDTKKSSSSDDDSSSSDEDEAPAKAEKKADKKADKPAAAAAPASAAVEALNGSKTVFVRNLPWSAGDDELRGFFESAGEIVDVRIATDRDTGRPKGFAHVQFAELEGAAAAIALSGNELGGREVYVDTTTERAPREWRFICCVLGWGGSGVVVWFVWGLGLGCSAWDLVCCLFRSLFHRRGGRALAARARPLPRGAVLFSGRGVLAHVPAGTPQSARARSQALAASRAPDC
jgi:nucleolin